MPDTLGRVTLTEATAAAEATADRFAPDAPANVRLVAVSRLALWYQHFPTDGVLTTDFSGQSVSYVRPGMVSALKGSGAGELLAPWRTPRARKVTTA